MNALCVRLWGRAAPVLLTLTLLAGCSFLMIPKYGIWRPAMRTFTSESKVPEGATLSIEVIGDTDPTHGEDTLLQGRLREMLSSLMERRGYRVTQGEAECHLRLIYHTVGSGSSSTLGLDVPAKLYTRSQDLNTALGVRFAEDLVIRNTSPTGAPELFRALGSGSFSHSVTLEFRAPGGEVLRRTDAVWRDGRIDLVESIRPVLQMAVSGLPSDPDYRPGVPEVKADKGDAYFQLHCRNQNFTCPALPYYIRFPHTLHSFEAPRYVGDPNAFAAFVDLIETAEAALPAGAGSPEYEYPTDPTLWARVVLGGSYRLEPSGEPIDVLINLESHEEGYRVTSCRIVSSSRFSKFQERLKRWQARLADYHDVFVR